MMQSPLAWALTAQNQANCHSIRPSLHRTGLIKIVTSCPSLVTNSSSLASLTPRNWPLVIREIFDWSIANCSAASDCDRWRALMARAISHASWDLRSKLALRRRTLRSNTPDGVRQELFGWVLAHYAVCWLTHHTPSEHKRAQRRLSFTGHVQLMRRSQPRSATLFRRAPPEAPGCADAGSGICCRRPLRCAAPATQAAATQEWSSGDTRPMPAMTRQNCRASTSTIHPHFLGQCLRRPWQSS